LSLSLHKLLDDQKEEVDFSANLSDSLKAELKKDIIEEIGLLVTEIQDVDSTIAEHAVEHIYAK
jgi:hypothetical protein